MIKIEEEEDFVGLGIHTYTLKVEVTLSRTAASRSNWESAAAGSEAEA